MQDERRAVHGLQRTIDERRISDAMAQHLAHQLEENVDLDALVQLASQACMPPVPEGHPAVSFDQEHRVRLAVARDAAFSMYYSEYVSCSHALHQPPEDAPFSMYYSECVHAIMSLFHWSPENAAVSMYYHECVPCPYDLHWPPVDVAFSCTTACMTVPLCSSSAI